MSDKQQWRTVCKHFPTDGHQLHRWEKSSERLAKQAVLDANHDAEIRGSDGFYSKCAPFRVQVRPVVEWEDAE